MRAEVTPLMLGMFKYELAGEKRQLVFQFNPESLSRSRSVAIEPGKVPDARGTGEGEASVVAGQTFASRSSNWSIHFKLRLDSTRKDAARDEASACSHETQPAGLEEALEELEELVEPTAAPGEKPPGEHLPEQAPLVDFHWGSRTWSGQITSLAITETMFTPDLRPARVEVDVSMIVLRSAQDVAPGCLEGEGE